MAKRKPSRTHPGGTASRSLGDKGKRKSFSKEGDTRTKRSFSDKPFEKRTSSSRFKREENNERPRRSFSAESGRENKSERPFDKRKSFNRSERAASLKSRRGFPEGFQRREDADDKKPFFKRRDDGAERPTKKTYGKAFERDARSSSSRGGGSYKEEGTKKPYGSKPGRSGDTDKRKPFRNTGSSREDFQQRNQDLTDQRSFKKERSFDNREVRADSSDTEKKFRKSFTESKTISSKGFKNYKGKEEEEKPQKMRLNRYIANSGVSSRREADEIIKMGLITVNGKTITEMGYQVQPGDIVKHEGKMLRAEKPIYILMNKPKGYLTTTSDPDDRMTVIQLVASQIKERIYPVGRLDRNTTGLLLLTNDGALAEQLSHPSYNVKKIYKVELDRPLSKADFEKIGQGVQLEEGRAMVDDLAIVSEDGKTVGLEIHIGWNRVVRRIFESLEYQVVKLDRTIYAGLDKKDLPRGKWRHLREEEIIRLKHLKKGTR
jgi:23S rRNA pseudouridine2605 synthase